MNVSEVFWSVSWTAQLSFPRWWGLFHIICKWINTSNFKQSERVELVSTDLTFCIIISSSNWRWFYEITNYFYCWSLLLERWGKPCLIQKPFHSSYIVFLGTAHVLACSLIALSSSSLGKKSLAVSSTSPWLSTISTETMNSFHMCKHFLITANKNQNRLYFGMYTSSSCLFDKVQ